jgi:Cu(I)/Ag(I) efflux system membrane fusion protein
MKAKYIILTLLVAVLAGTGGWFAARWSARQKAAAKTSADIKGRVLYYQSPMHPWIKSDKPGRCTICGMELSPVYEGEKGLAVGEGVVALGSNVIQVINVQTDEVKRRPLRRSLRFAGTIEDNDARHRIVAAYIDGRIDKLFVNYVGAEVVASEPLATFYSPSLLAAEREWVSLLQQAPGSSSSALTGEHRRFVEAAKLRLKRYGLTDEQIAALREKDPNDIHSEILAPASGTVVERSIYEGQYVKEGDKLFEIADFSTMWFLFDAYERDLAWLQVGQKVIVTTPAVPGKTFLGTITFIDPNLREMTRSTKVRVELPNPLLEENGRKRRELYHKLYADAVVDASAPEVLAVPRSAVLSPGTGPVVYVDQGGGAYEQRKVRLGRVGDGDYEVLDGLSAGERVVTQGNVLIDAQAQLHANVSSGASHQHGLPTSPETTGKWGTLPPLTTPQRKAVKEFLNLADALAASLAADDLNQFNAHTEKTHSTVPALTAAFSADSPWRQFVGRAERVGHLASATDLKAARKNFHPLSEAVAELAKTLRKKDNEFSDLKIFRCPMTKDAFPGAPRTAEWIQMQLPIRNPYFGAEMLDCGSEVK